MSPSGRDVLVECPKCRARFLARAEPDLTIPFCLRCWAFCPVAGPEEGGVALDALYAGVRPRIRLHTWSGYVFDYTGPLDQDIRALLWDSGAGTLTLHASAGSSGRFTHSGQTDDEGYAIYMEDPYPFHTAHAYSPDSSGWLRPEQTFDYNASVPAPGEPWTVQSTRTQTPTDQLLGRSPRLHIEPAGILRGGGPVSPVCNFVRPAVSASRICLTRDDASGVSARTAWFYLESALVNSLRPGDRVNMARTQRGGLGVSVIRGDRLVVAIGAVTAVPVGTYLAATLRRDSLIRIPILGGPPTPWLSTFQLTTTDPIPRKPKGYSAAVWYVPTPDQERDECVSIACDDLFRMNASASSALLLATSDALYVDGSPAWT